MPRSRSKRKHAASKVKSRAGEVRRIVFGALARVGKRAKVKRPA